MGTWVNWWFQNPTTMFVRPAHPGMHGAVPQEQAEGRIVGVGRHAPDRVARVDVLEADLDAAPLEVLLDRVPQEDADVADT